MLVNINVFAHDLIKFAADKFFVGIALQDFADLLAALLNSVLHAMAVRINRLDELVIEVLTLD